MKIAYCVECAAPLKQENLTKYTCPNGHFFWNNPKLAVCLVLLKDNKVLLAKRALEPKKGLYDMPGGFVDYGETPEEAMHRELAEETGLSVETFEILDLQGHEYEENVPVCDIYFVSREWKGTPDPKDDVASLDWLPIDTIDSPQFAWKAPGLTDKIKAYLEQA